MIFRKVVGLVAAFAAIAAAAVVCVVALAFSLYAAVREYVGPAWGAAAVALTVALMAVILAFLVTRKARPPKPVKGDGDNLAARLIDLARERPLVALAAVGAAAAVIVRNPRVLSAVIAAFFAGKPPPTKPKG